MTQWLYWVKRKYARTKLDCCLSLGWGDGSLELHSLSMGLCNLFDAHDLSGESIRMAKGLCEKLGYKDRINYQVTDINTIELEASKYDIVFACISLHHIAELEHVLGQIRKSLKPGGYFIFNEYVGLSQFQWTDKQLQIMNDLLGLLPARYRVDLTTGALKDRIYRNTIEWMNTFDPSEAIRSEEIMPCVSRYFSIEEKIDYCGTILHPLLHNTVGNFDWLIENFLITAVS